MGIIFVGFVLLSFGVSSNACAQDVSSLQSDPGYFEIVSHETVVTPDVESHETSLEVGHASEAFDPDASILSQKMKSFEGGVGLPSELEVVKLGLQVWDVFERNKAVVSAQSAYASALPRGQTDWTKMSGWKPSTGVTIEHIFKNILGMQVVDLKYSVSQTAGGNYAGRGRYIASVQVIPVHVEALWGYTVNMKTDIGQAVNMGTVQEPVAALDLDVSWSVHNILKVTHVTESYRALGTGQLIQK